MLDRFVAVASVARESIQVDMALAARPFLTVILLVGSCKLRSRATRRNARYGAID
jgi:hypothetical protein